MSVLLEDGTYFSTPDFKGVPYVHDPSDFDPTFGAGPFCEDTKFFEALRAWLKGVLRGVWH